MPIRLDHDERRSRLARAVWDVVARDGVAAASVRGVAREAGLSMGSVRHSFSTQDELLRFAVSELVENVRRRIDAGAADRAAAAADGGPLDAAVALLGEILPLDDQRLVEARVWAAFTGPGATDPAIATIRHRADEGIAELCRTVVRELDDGGYLHRDRDIDAEARRVHVLVDGMTLHLLLDPTARSADDATAMLRAHLADLQLPAARASDSRRAVASPSMARVTGIGGFFFASDDPERLSAWYAEHLDVSPPPTSYEAPVWQQDAGPTVFAPFRGDEPNDHLGPSGWGLNLRVDDLDGMVERLRAAGHDVTVDPDAYPNGRFAQLRDPDGNPVQLWQPIDP